MIARYISSTLALWKIATMAALLGWKKISKFPSSGFEPFSPRAFVQESTIPNQKAQSAKPKQDDQLYVFAYRKQADGTFVVVSSQIDRLIALNQTGCNIVDRVTERGSLEYLIVIEQSYYVKDVYRGLGTGLPASSTSDNKIPNKIISTKSSLVRQQQPTSKNSSN